MYRPNPDSFQKEKHKQILTLFYNENAKEFLRRHMDPQMTPGQTCVLDFMKRL